MYKYMDDIKVFAKKEKELETLIQTIRIYIEDLGMEFGIKISAMQIRKSEQRESAEGIEISNQKCIWKLG